MNDAIGRDIKTLAPIARRCWVYGNDASTGRIVIMVPSRKWLKEGGESREDMASLEIAENEPVGDFISRVLRAAGYSVEGTIT